MAGAELTAGELKGGKRAVKIGQDDIGKGKFAKKLPEYDRLIKANEAIWTDPRSIRIIQDLVGANDPTFSGTFDHKYQEEDPDTFESFNPTVNYIAQWQKENFKEMGFPKPKKLKDGNVETDIILGVVNEPLLQYLYKNLVNVNRAGNVSAGNFNAVYQLLIDQYNIYDTMPKLSGTGEMTGEVTEAERKKGYHTYSGFLGGYYVLDALPESDTEAATTAGTVEGLPSMVLFGQNSMYDYQSISHTLPHEFLHTIQHLEAERMPSGMREVYAELMEIRGQLGDIQLPEKDAIDDKSSSVRVVYEYLSMKPEQMANPDYQAAYNEAYDRTFGTWDGADGNLKGKYTATMESLIKMKDGDKSDQNYRAQSDQIYIAQEIKIMETGRSLISAILAYHSNPTEENLKAVESFAWRFSEPAWLIPDPDALASHYKDLLSEQERQDLKLFESETRANSAGDEIPLFDTESRKNLERTFREFKNSAKHPLREILTKIAELEEVLKTDTELKASTEETDQELLSENQIKKMKAQIDMLKAFKERIGFKEYGFSK